MRSRGPLRLLRPLAMRAAWDSGPGDGGGGSLRRGESLIIIGLAVAARCSDRPVRRIVSSVDLLEECPYLAEESDGGVRASIPEAGFALILAVLRRLLSLGISPIDGRRPRLPCGRAVVGVLKALRFDGRRKAVDISSALGEMADSAIGVTPAAMGVCPPSLDEKNFDLELCSPKEVMSLSADVLAMLR